MPELQGEEAKIVHGLNDTDVRELPCMAYRCSTGLAEGGERE